MFHEHVDECNYPEKLVFSHENSLEFQYFECWTAFEAHEHLGYIVTMKNARVFRILQVLRFSIFLGRKIGTTSPDWILAIEPILVHLCVILVMVSKSSMLRISKSDFGR